MSRLNGSEKDLLTKMLGSHGYREKLAVERYKQAAEFAPTSRDLAYLNHIVEEETDHYQGCLRVADELDIDLESQVSARMLLDPPGIPPFENWLDVLLAHSLNDRAGYHVITGLIGSRVSAYARLASEIVSEEEAHGEYGTAALVKYYPLCDHPEKKDQLVAHLDSAIRCLGKPNSRNDVAAIRMGLKTKPSVQVISEFCQAVDPILAELGTGDLMPLSSRYLK
jgi:1,2-phenylacetyl-CoA epoxidase catalytic subunit